MKMETSPTRESTFFTEHFEMKAHTQRLVELSILITSAPEM
jgi:hypothetical protein